MQAENVLHRMNKYNELRTINISNTGVQLIRGFWEENKKIYELVESGRATTEAFFKEQERRLERLRTFEHKDITYRKYDIKPVYVVFKYISGPRTILGVEIMGESISFHTNYKKCIPTSNSYDEQFSFENLSKHDERFKLFIHLDKNENTQAEEILNNHRSFFENCFLWDIFRQIIVENNCAEYLQFFISKGFSFASPTFCPFAHAIKYHADISYNELFLKDSFTPNKVDGNSLLLTILKSTDYFTEMTVSYVNFLLNSQYKTDVNKSNTKGETPLCLVARYDHSEGRLERNELFNLLLDTDGVDINIQDELGNTALHYVVFLKEEKRVTTLINNGINLNITNKQGRTALHLTLDENIYNELKDNGADLNIQDKEAYRPTLQNNLKPKIENFATYTCKSYKHLHESNTPLKLKIVEGAVMTLAFGLCA